MIVSASRRTDLPNYYPEWLCARFRAGFVLVRSPYDAHRVFRVPLTPDVVDGVVFWTKNPRPMLKFLPEFSAWPYYFQFTVTPYGADLEPNVPPAEEAIETFRQLSGIIGPERVLWRYDPVLLGGAYDMEFHRRAFDRMAHSLSGAAHRCTFSFLDRYQSMPKSPGMRPPDAKEGRELASLFAESAASCRMELATCCEEIDLSDLHISRTKCVDDGLLEKIAGVSLRVPKEKNQRPGCNCASSVDIGTYGTCPNRCRYCYASGGRKLGPNCPPHDPAGPLLFGRVGPEDIVTERKLASCRDDRISFF